MLQAQHTRQLLFPGLGPRSGAFPTAPHLGVHGASRWRQPTGDVSGTASASKAVSVPASCPPSHALGPESLGRQETTATYLSTRTFCQRAQGIPERSLHLWHLLTAARWKEGWTQKAEKMNPGLGLGAFQHLFHTTLTERCGTAKCHWGTSPGGRPHPRFQGACSPPPLS